MLWVQCAGLKLHVCHYVCAAENEGLTEQQNYSRWYILCALLYGNWLHISKERGRERDRDLCPPETEGLSTKRCSNISRTMLLFLCPPHSMSCCSEQRAAGSHLQCFSRSSWKHMSAAHEGSANCVPYRKTTKLQKQSLHHHLVFWSKATAVTCSCRVVLYHLKRFNKSKWFDFIIHKKIKKYYTCIVAVRWETRSVSQHSGSVWVKTCFIKSWSFGWISRWRALWLTRTHQCRTGINLD